MARSRRFGINTLSAAGLALTLAAFISGVLPGIAIAQSASPSASPLVTPSASPLAAPPPAIVETATIVLPTNALPLTAPGYSVKPAAGSPPRMLGKWTYRGQLLVVSDDGPYSGTLAELGAQARATLEADGGKVVTERAIKICKGTQDGWYMEGTFDAANHSFHNEAVLAVGTTNAFRATYSRLVLGVEYPAAHAAIQSLCVSR